MAKGLQDSISHRWRPLPPPPSTPITKQQNELKLALLSSQHAWFLLFELQLRRLQGEGGTLEIERTPWCPDFFTS